MNNLRKKLLKLDKRIRFVISTLFLSMIMFVATFFYFDKAFIFLPLIIAACYLLTYFSILEGIEKIEWSMLFFMPIVVSIAFYISYFLFPARWLTRIPFLLIYAVMVYATLLCSNIFNVGVEKSLQLYRAAFSVNLLFQVIVSYLLINIIFSFKLFFIFNIILVFLIIYCLALQLIWTLKLELKLEKTVFVFSLLLAVIISQLSGVVAFVPFQSNISTLFLTATYYSISGLCLNYLDQKLFKETIREYLTVLIFVFVVCLFSLSW